MDVHRALETRLEVRRYTDEAIPPATRRSILEAARGAPSGKNLQHWRFVVIEDESDLARLAEHATTGGWIEGANFAVVVVTDPAYDYHAIDAGRAITHMQLAAWDAGVGSCIYTGFDEAAMRSFLAVPEDRAVTAVVGFGYPKFDIEELEGRKDRAPFARVVRDGRFNTPLEDLDGVDQ